MSTDTWREVAVPYITYVPVKARVAWVYADDNTTAYGEPETLAPGEHPLDRGYLPTWLDRPVVRYWREVLVVGDAPAPMPAPAPLAPPNPGETTPPPPPAASAPPPLSPVDAAYVKGIDAVVRDIDADNARDERALDIAAKPRQLDHGKMAEATERQAAALERQAAALAAPAPRSLVQEELYILGCVIRDGSATTPATATLTKRAGELMDWWARRHPMPPTA
jgi:hypothetical protein